MTTWVGRWGTDGQGHNTFTVLWEKVGASHKDVKQAIMGVPATEGQPAVPGLGYGIYDVLVGRMGDKPLEYKKVERDVLG
jgi:hypothetical protein